MSERVRIVGDHPWKGESGTATVERNMGLAGWMVEVRLDNQGMGYPEAVMADRDQLKPLPRDEDPNA